MKMWSVSTLLLPQLRRFVLPPNVSKMMNDDRQIKFLLNFFLFPILITKTSIDVHLYYCCLLYQLKSFILETEYFFSCDCYGHAKTCTFDPYDNSNPKYVCNCDPTTHTIGDQVNPLLFISFFYYRKLAL